jgi:drug/metabolite transporter (DMT)-like permease
LLTESLNQPQKAPLFIVFAAVIWAVDGIILRPTLYSLSVPMVVLIESTIAFVLLTPFLYHHYTELAKLKQRDWLAFFLVALFGGAIGTMAITKALFYVNYINLSIVVLIQKLQPVFAIALAALLLKEKLNKSYFFWGGVAIVSSYFMTFGISIPSLANNENVIAAALFALLSAFSFGASTVFSKRGLRNIRFETATYLRLLLTAVLLLPVTFALEGGIPLKTIEGHQWGVFFVIAFVTGIISTFAYYFGLKKVKASVATIAELTFPMAAILLEFIIRDNLLSAVQWLAAVLLLFAIYKVSNTKQRYVESG